MSSGGHSPSESPPLRRRALEILVLTSFALSQPLLALVGANPTFLVAHGLEGWEIVAFGCAVILVPTTVFTLVGFLAGQVNTGFGDWAHRSTLGILIGLTLGPPINRLLSLGGIISVGSLLILTAISTFVITRYQSLRRVIRYAAPAPLLFLALFLLNTSSGPSPAQDDIAQIELTKTPPIVWMVFDQLPLPLLLDGQGELLAERYPGFARLAQTSTWYPNAATVAVNTHLAIPSIVTGNYPSPDRVPTAEEYPSSVFTLLSDDYFVTARESVTRLCSAEICDDANYPSSSLAPLFGDSAIILARLLLADNIADKFLPPINDRWAHFGRPGIGFTDGSRRVTGDDRWRFEEFLAELGSTDTPTLYYIHQEKPHEPLLMLPDGRVYDFCSCYQTDSEGRWPSDPAMMNQRLQQYVLQTMYVDTQVGRVLDRMADRGILEDSILVVVSDHGASMRPGQINRSVSASTSADVFPVPMFIKLPGQTSGAVDQRLVSLIDIVPTLLDALGAHDLGTTRDGASLLTNVGQRPFSAITTEGEKELAWPDATSSQLTEMIQRMMPIPTDPYAFGPHGHLVGAPVDELLGGTSKLTARLIVPEPIVTVRLDSDYAPARVIGELFGNSSPTPLAVSFNGTIAGVGSTYYNDLWRISIMGDPQYFVDGENEVKLYEVDGPDLLQVPLTG